MHSSFLEDEHDYISYINKISQREIRLVIPAHQEMHL